MAYTSGSGTLQYYLTDLLEPFSDISETDWIIFLRLHEDLLFGHIEAYSQFFFGIFRYDRGYFQGVIVSEIQRNGGIFTAKKPPTPNPNQICFYIRKDGGEVSQACIRDQTNKLRIYGNTSHFLI
jgi:hypothetical protein